MMPTTLELSIDALLDAVSDDAVAEGCRADQVDDAIDLLVTSILHDEDVGVGIECSATEPLKIELFSTYATRKFSFAKVIDWELEVRTAINKDGMMAMAENEKEELRHLATALEQEAVRVRAFIARV